MTDLRDLISYSPGGILSKSVVNANGLDVSLFCMAAGTVLSEHTSTKRGFVLVLEGNGVFTLKGKKIAMKPSEFIFMDKNAVHSVKAVANTSFLLCLSE